MNIMIKPDFTDLLIKSPLFFFFLLFSLLVLFLMLFFPFFYHFNKVEISSTSGNLLSSLSAPRFRA